MLTKVARIAAGRLSPDRKRQVHAVLDPLLLPLGSVLKAKRPTQAVALTFDDGPDPAHTPRILDVLADRGCKATFFLLVDEAIKYPDVVRRIVADGHEVGLHSDNHDRLTTLPPWRVYQRLRRARARLETLAGVPVTQFRPPFGSQSLVTFIAARATGLSVVVWSVTPQDWEEQSAEQAANRMLSVVKGGDIALMHDGLAVPEGEVHPTFDRARMLDLIIVGLRDRGLLPNSVEGLVATAGATKSAWFRT